MKHIDLKESKGWKVILLMVALIFVFLLLYSIATLAIESIQPLLPSSIIGMLIGFVLLTIYYFAIRFTEGKSPEHLKLSQILKQLFSGLAVGFLFFIVITLILFSLGCYSIGQPTFHPFIIKALVEFFIVACAEEIIFRGIMFRMLDERWGYWTAMIVSGLVFGFMHLPNPNATIW